MKELVHMKVLSLRTKRLVSIHEGFDLKMT